jgi:serine/threonine protein kinase
MKKDSHVLWLNLTSERDSSIEFDVMGTLEDIMHMHARFNIGPLPESISAHIISQVLQCVGTLHRAGVTHNDLGLDSFLLVRRKLGGEQEWYLVCTGLGAKAIVCKDPVGKRGDKNRKRWPFNRDLYGVANIAHLLLSGGSPLAWKRDVSGSIALQSTHAYSSIFMRGKLTWECLFQTLLNPMDETSSLDLAESGKWGEKMLSAINMLRTVSGRSEQNGARNKGFFNELMEHIRHKQVASFSIRPNERFPVKLIVRSRDERQGHTVSKTSIIALERNISRLASLKEDLELNLQNEHKAKESLREETKAARKEAEAARKELTKAVSHSQDLNEELQGLRLKHDAFKRKALKHEQGFKRTIAEQTRALSTLRNRLQQGQVALTAEIKATNANLNSRLRELEKELQMREHEKMVLSAQLESAKCTLRIRDQEKANQTGHLDASISQLELDLSESTRLMEGQTNYYGQEKHLLDEGVSELRNQLQDSTEKQKTSVAQGELDPLEILRNFREDKLNWGEDRQYEMEENGTRTEEEATKGEQEARGTGNERKRHRDPRDEAADVQPPVETIVIANQMSISANKKKRLSLPSKSKASSASCGDSPRPNISSSTSTRQRLMSTVNRQCDVPKPSLAVAAPAPTQRPREIQKSSNKTDFQNFNKGNSE